MPTFYYYKAIISTWHGDSKYISPVTTCRHMTSLPVISAVRTENTLPKERNISCSFLSSSDPSGPAAVFHGNIETNHLSWHVVALLENDCRWKGGLCVIQEDCCGEALSKKCSVLLWVDAAEPAYHSRLWLGRSPACTHLSPSQDRKTQTEGTGKYTAFIILIGGIILKLQLITANLSAFHQLHSPLKLTVYHDNKTGRDYVCCIH